MSARDARRQTISAEAPLQPQSARGRRLRGISHVFTISAAVAFVALAWQAHTRELLPADLPIARAIQGVHQPLYDWVLTHVSDLGYFPGSWISYAAVVSVLYLMGLRLAAGLAGASALLAALMGTILRALVARPRPSPSLVHVVNHVTGFGFPSGHVIHYVTLFGFCFYLLQATRRSALLRNLTLALLFFLVVLVGPSRIYLGAHWPSDVLGGYLFGAVWLAGTIELYPILARRLGTA